MYSKYSCLCKDLTSRSVAPFILSPRYASYKSTLNNPLFPFPIGISSKNRSSRQDPDLESVKDCNFILHDGPPYANGPIHFGHALNKILKDFVIRFQKLQGKSVSFVPGWDCHGLPIELTAVGNNLCLPPDVIRRASFKHAKDCMDDQLSSFKCLNILADWKHSYSTHDPSYQATVIRSFRDLHSLGYIVREHKPVYWSRATRTAISEYELEYNPDHESPSLYFLVVLTIPPAWLPTRFRCYPTCAVVWTTTPWTIAANEAIIFNRTEEYAALFDRQSKRILVMASYFVPKLCEVLSCDSERFEMAAKLRGDDIENHAYEHPLNQNGNRVYRLMPGDFIERDKGTGFVHCAPAHGKEDFNFGRQHHLPIRLLVDADTKFTPEAGEYLAGLDVQEEGSKAVIKRLGDRVLALGSIRHSFPYEWRTKQPVITRVSEQWFINTEKLESLAKETYAEVRVFPPERKPMMQTFIEQRPFWCISRQRNWGVPIPVLYHRHNGRAIIDGDFIEAVAERVAREGSEFWWSSSLSNSQLIPPKCLEKWNLAPQTADMELTRGTDIFDVWFESGLSWRAVLPEGCVADVYLEGLDQFRGWFSSSLLLSVALTKRAPFRNLIVHGFTTDGEGRKMSKSLGNVLAPQDVLDSAAVQGCTDVLRRWAAASALSTKSATSEKIFLAHVVSYRKLRNMFRFMLGNTNDLLIAKGRVSLVSLSSSDLKLALLDRWCLALVGEFCSDCLEIYYPEHRYEALIAASDRLVAKLSSIYFNAVKDVLYCDAPDSPDRRAVQHTLLFATEALRVCLAPILPDMISEIDNALKTQITGEETQAIAQVLPLLSKKWSGDMVSLSRAISQATTMRQAIAAQQQDADGFHLWPGPVANPLARLHIIVLEKGDPNYLKSLKRLNDEMDSQGTSTLCKVLRCASVRFGDTSERSGCVELNLNLNSSQENGFNITCLLRVAHDSTQCPRCRRYCSVNKRLCSRCAKTVSKLKQESNVN